mmetsp:Transcript_10449/g.26289  ORF Transcript_10449/g.26289 Transcript_10449/m.26289 type:complete len:200 (-) Transcript_10449:1688-2287(-)
MASTVTSVKAVASPSSPVMADTLPSKHSTKWPSVMREGIAWGLTMMSGTTPSTVNGMSSWRYVIPHVPFCPCRLLNLSPIWGMRTDRMRTFTSLNPSELVLNMTWSMMPVSLDRSTTELSRLVYRCCFCPRSLSFWLRGVVLPTMTSSPDTRVPGAIRPSSSSLSYEPCRMPWHVSREGFSNSSYDIWWLRFSSSRYER